MTISEVLKSERLSLVAAMERDGMEDAGTLKDAASDRTGGERFLWLGGFNRFALIAGIRADWWVVEGKGWQTSSWCCCPCDRVYRRVSKAGPIERAARAGGSSQLIGFDGGDGIG